MFYPRSYLHVFFVAAFGLSLTWGYRWVLGRNLEALSSLRVVIILPWVQLGASEFQPIQHPLSLCMVSILPETLCLFVDSCLALYSSFLTCLAPEQRQLSLPLPSLQHLWDASSSWYHKVMSFYWNCKEYEPIWIWSCQQHALQGCEETMGQREWYAEK